MERLAFVQDDIALTDCTSMGTSFLYTGMKLKPGEGILTTIHDHFSTEMAIAECAARTGCTVHRIAMFQDPATASESEIIDSIHRAISPKTRVVAVTWVHSSTGVKIPVRKIGDLIEVRCPERRDTVMLPFTDATVPVVDIAGGRVVIDPPQGLFKSRT